MTSTTLDSPTRPLSNLKAERPRSIFAPHSEAGRLVNQAHDLLIAAGCLPDEATAIFGVLTSAYNMTARRHDTHAYWLSPQQRVQTHAAMPKVLPTGEAPSTQEGTAALAACALAILGPGRTFLHVSTGHGAMRTCGLRILVLDYGSN